jgi:hypothetical protein
VNILFIDDGGREDLSLVVVNIDTTQLITPIAKSQQDSNYKN